MVRQLAWEVLRSGSVTPLREADFAAREVGLDGRDRALLRAIVGSEVRHRGTLRVLVAAFARGNPKPGLRTHLHVGFAQLLYMDRIPARAAVSEQVDATRRTLGASKTTYVNAILRTFIRDRKPGHSGDPRCDIVGTDWHFERPLFHDPEQHPALWAEDALSIPANLFKRWHKRLGLETAMELGRLFHEAPDLSLRAVGRERDEVRDELLAAFAESGGVAAIEAAAAEVAVADGERAVARAAEAAKKAAAEAAKKASVETSPPAEEAPITLADDVVPDTEAPAVDASELATPTEEPKPKRRERFDPLELLDGKHPSILLARGTVAGLFEGEAFTSGRVTVQGETALRAAELVGAQPGEDVLDLCAAPGGKTAVLAATGAKVVAVDVSEPKLLRLGETLTRLGVADAVELIEARPLRADVVDDETPEFAPGPADYTNLGTRDFDAVLVDAPCSNTGVLGSRPGARWRFGPANQKALIELQQQLLLEGANRVRPGGRLVWSTCSIESDENQQLVNRFVAAHDDWTLEAEIESLPASTEAGGPIDGGYAARLRRA